MKETAILMLFLYTQAQRYSVAVYIVGFVIGVSPLCVTVMSPLVGYFVSISAELRKLISFFFYKNFCARTKNTRIAIG